MTELDKKALVKVLASTKNVAITTSIYTLSGDSLNRQEITSAQEASKLRRSTDFQKGWAMCHAHIQMYLESLITGTEQEIKKFVGKR